MQRNDPNLEPLNNLVSALNKLDELCRGASIDLSKDKIEQVIAQIPEICILKEESEDISNQLNSAVVTKSVLTDMLINDWYERKTIELLQDPNFKMPGYDIRIDFLNYAYELAKEMKQANIDHVRPENANIYGKFFKANDAKTVYSRNACPLIKTGDVYKFAHKGLCEYFIGRSIHEELQNLNNFSM